jgi:hypothetical protein
VSIEGLATMGGDEPSILDVPDHAEKYRDPIADLGFDNARFAEAYSVAIRVTPSRWRVAD